MTSPYSWHPPAPSSTLERYDPVTAARLTDLSQACNALAMAVAGVTAAGEAAEMRFSQLAGDDDGPPKTPYLLLAEDAACKASLRAAAELTAHFTRTAVIFAAQASAAAMRLMQAGDAGDTPATPAPSDFLRQPEAVLPPVAERVSGLEDVDLEALDAAYQQVLEHAWRCRGDGFDQYDDPSAAEAGLTANLAVAAHTYAVLLVHAGRNVGV
ncbi:hypothetical protein [Dactylosporangium sp. CA-139066]|uniref:hypothetical protein n=1 Tax=Dactylosporangium sp. CA-139066 TaxID=3239930 RepID=UPI003D8C843B